MEVTSHPPPHTHTPLMATPQTRSGQVMYSSLSPNHQQHISLCQHCSRDLHREWSVGLSFFSFSPSLHLPSRIFALSFIAAVLLVLCSTEIYTPTHAEQEILVISLCSMRKQRSKTWFLCSSILEETSSSLSRRGANLSCPSSSPITSRRPCVEAERLKSANGSRRSAQLCSERFSTSPTTLLHLF